MIALITTDTYSLAGLFIFSGVNGTVGSSCFSGNAGLVEMNTLYAGGMDKNNVVASSVECEGNHDHLKIATCIYLLSC